ncbi:MAG: hypothetical protein ACJ79H_22450 [Myxococcales bacterium]
MARRKRKKAAAPKRRKATAATGKKSAKKPARKKIERPRAVAPAEALRNVRLRIDDGDPNWNLLGDLRGPTRIITGVAVRRTRPADRALEPGEWHYDFDATGGSGEFALEAVSMPGTSLAKEPFQGPDVLRFLVP